MRKLGWIFAIFGILSCIGAATANNSTIGPLFFIALGIFLIHKSDEKSEKDSSSSRTIVSSQSASISSSQNEISNSKRKISIDQIYSGLTRPQREASMCLIAFFGGFNNNSSNDFLVRKISENAASFFGFKFTEDEMAFILSHNTDITSIIDSIKTIRQKNVIEFLLLSCHDLVKISHSTEAEQVLKFMISEIGYDYVSFKNLVNTYS